MASKKYILLAGVFCLLVSASFSQTQKRSYEDSSVIPSKRMPQYTEFMAGTNNYPAKPRNQWEIGLKVGTFHVNGDVQAQFLTPGFGVHVRKAFGYVFSMRLEYNYGIGKGLDWTSNENYAKNSAWEGNTVATRYSAAYSPAGGPVVSSMAAIGGNPATPIEPVYYNYKTNVQDLSLQGVVTLNNIRFHKAQTKFTFYGFGGIGLATYDTKINAFNGTAKYNFSSIAGNVYKNRKDTKNALKDLLDDSYETPAQNQGNRRAKLGGKTMRPSFIVGAGMAFRLSSRINLALEDRVSILKDDLIDGQQWAEHPWGDAGLTSNFDTYNLLSLGININIGKNAVQPLWWINPLDYAYAEIRNPHLMKLPKPVLPDSDGDGVTDQFDREQTPAGCPVDTHGVSRDTDGDGVPDCKDKELVTPTYCQPVDADGVGKCPCPDPSCFPKDTTRTGCSEKLGALPSVTFKSGSNNLTEDAQAVLGSVASRMRNNPECKVVVVGYCASDKKQQQLSWDHVNKVISYLVEKEGISADRFIFSYGQEGGDCNTVDLRGANEGEDGPNTVAPPHPNLRKK
jgi:outer membrane protein OmpA-like peptidoglycan-associated protein